MKIVVFSQKSQNRNGQRSSQSTPFEFERTINIPVEFSINFFPRKLFSWFHSFPKGIVFCTKNYCFFHAKSSLFHEKLSYFSCHFFHENSSVWNWIIHHVYFSLVCNLKKGMKFGIQNSMFSFFAGDGEAMCCLQLFRRAGL